MLAKEETEGTKGCSNKAAIDNKGLNCQSLFLVLLDPKKSPT